MITKLKDSNFAAMLTAVHAQRPLLTKITLGLALLASSTVAQADFLGLPLKSVVDVALENLTSNAKQSSVQVSVIAPVVGAWSLQGDGYKTCQEVYNFQPDGRMIVTSAQEVTTAEYSFVNNAKTSQTTDMEVVDATKNAVKPVKSKEVEVKLAVPVLAFIINYDNNKPDCLGNQVDQVGDNQAYFAVIDKNRQSMRWCLEDNACPLTFKRLLP